MLDVLINPHSTPPMVTIYSFDVSSPKVIEFKVNLTGDGPTLEPVEISPYASTGSAFSPVGPEAFRNGEFQEVTPEFVEKIGKTVAAVCHPRGVKSRRWRAIEAEHSHPECACKTPELIFDFERWIHMRPGSLAYKCRLCGAVFYPVHTPDGPTMVSYLLDGQPIPYPWHGARPTSTEVHRCSAVIDGVADFAGVQYDQPHGEADGQAAETSKPQDPARRPEMQDQQV